MSFCASDMSQILVRRRGMAADAEWHPPGGDGDQVPVMFSIRISGQDMGRYLCTVSNTMCDISSMREACCTIRDLRQ